jgi:MerR family transcriptional regulator, redox-sensitive transcriptional activator SoxR
MVEVKLVLFLMSQMSWKTHELTVGDLSQRSGVPASALRFYEREGLIHSRRTTGNQRRYTRDTLRRVAFVRSSQRVGIPLARIRDALSLFPEDHVLSKEDWAQISECWRQDLTERIEQLLSLRDSLTDCIGCGCLSIDKCALANRHDQLGEQGPGARRLLKSCSDTEGPGVCGSSDQDVASPANKASVRTCSSDVPTGEAMSSVAPASTSSRNSCSTVDLLSCGPAEPSRSSTAR